MIDIVRMITISTAHISEDTACRLNVASLTNDMFSLVIYAKEGYGWFISWNGNDEDWRDDETIPNDLRKCIEYAIKHSCQWLCLDCDGIEANELPIYDW